MPACGSEPKQTAHITGTDPGPTAKRALDIARQEAMRACDLERCNKGKCVYTESKVVGELWSDANEKQWVSNQTSSGKCSCEEGEATQPCKREIEQMAQYFAAGPIDAGNHARTLARSMAQHACESGKCPDVKGAKKNNKCEYQEIKIEGTTWKDAASGKYVSKQTTIGKCRCEVVWL